MGSDPLAGVSTWGDLAEFVGPGGSMGAGGSGAVMVPILPGGLCPWWVVPGPSRTSTWGGCGGTAAVLEPAAAGPVLASVGRARSERRDVVQEELERRGRGTGTDARLVCRNGAAPRGRPAVSMG